MTKIKQISITQIEYIAHRLAVDTMSWNEPISTFDTRYPNILESCILTPFKKFDKKFLYSGLGEKAAILFYLLIKNHPFQNGNKRIAVTTLLVFLFLNGKWLKVDKQKLHNTSTWVAQSPSEAKEEVIAYVAKFIRQNLVNAPENNHE